MVSFRSFVLFFDGASPFEFFFSLFEFFFSLLFFSNLYTLLVPDRKVSVLFKQYFTNGTLQPKFESAIKSITAVSDLTWFQFTFLNDSVVTDLVYGKE